MARLTKDGGGDDLSIRSEVDRLKKAVSDSYSAIQTLGGTLPSVQSAANLASTIASIPCGVNENLLINPCQT